MVISIARVRIPLLLYQLINPSTNKAALDSTIMGSEHAL
jgi:hypothetical protein